MFSIVTCTGLFWWIASAARVLAHAMALAGVAGSGAATPPGEDLSITGAGGLGGELAGLVGDSAAGVVAIPPYAVLLVADDSSTAPPDAAGLTLAGSS